MFCILWVFHFNYKFSASFNWLICLFIAFDITIHMVWRCQKWSPQEVGWERALIKIDIFVRKPTPFLISLLESHSLYIVTLNLESQLENFETVVILVIIDMAQLIVQLRLCEVLKWKTRANRLNISDYRWTE